MANTGNTTAFINAQQYGKKKTMKYKSPVVKNKKKKKVMVAKKTKGKSKNYG
jgi:hypothetical protein|tara:strand:- start:385 stop:540 length:156 start_codon:yes stop_codon:yes gene_type:complete